MKTRFLSVLICALLLLSALPISVFASEKSDDLVILYENDVHCSIDGYSKLAALKNELLETHESVAVVSSGDFIQGGSLGVISKGEYIVNLMNLVGYDAVALGNHEFDYHISRLDELVEMMDAKPVCCNFEKLGEDESYYDPYRIVTYGDKKVAYIGVTTPSTVTASSPAQFKDENGNFIFTFNPDDLFGVVQESIDEVLELGADYVIALSHIGDKEPDYDIKELIASTSGLDVVLDAHSHSVIDGETVNDADGNGVLLCSTGTKFEYIGKLTISDEGITSELIRTEDLSNTDPTVDAYIAQINEEFSELGNRVIAQSDVLLTTKDENGNRLVRIDETNLGNLIADAFRTVMGAEIGYFNGGGIRADIEAGEITFNDILTVLPFNNYGAVIETDGQAILDMLELAMSLWPEENGTFPHVSGIKFSVNTAIESNVVVDQNGDFIEVDGEYRVYDVKVLDSESGEYKPLELQRKYTLASNNYSILEYGGGFSMLRDSTVIRDEGILDVEILEEYISEQLGGVIGEEYASAKGNITFTDGRIGQELNSGEDTDKKNDDGLIIWISVAGASLLAVAISVIAIKKKRSK